MSDEYFKVGSDYKPSEMSIALAKREEREAMARIDFEEFDDYENRLERTHDDDHEWFEASMWPRKGNDDE